jgi:hypothetical protein
MVIFAPWQQAGFLSSGGLALLAAAASYAIGFAYMGRKLAGRGVPTIVLSAARVDHRNQHERAHVARGRLGRAAPDGARRGRADRVTLVKRGGGVRADNRHHDLTCPTAAR